MSLKYAFLPPSLTPLRKKRVCSASFFSFVFVVAWHRVVVVFCFFLCGFRTFLAFGFFFAFFYGRWEWDGERKVLRTLLTLDS